jgi:hypothetical protein
MKTKTPPPKTGRLWLEVPGQPDKNVRIEFITEVDFGPDCYEETTSAIDAGLVLDALRRGQAKIRPQQPRI